MCIIDTFHLRVTACYEPRLEPLNGSLRSEFDLIYPDYVKPIEVISFEKKNNQKLYLNEFNKILISLFLTFALVIAYLIGNYFYLLVKSSINDK